MEHNENFIQIRKERQLIESKTQRTIEKHTVLKKKVQIFKEEREKAKDCNYNFCYHIEHH